MKKIFENIKDFIYDSVDYLIMITIIAIVVIIIGWRINVLFADKNNDDLIVISEQAEEITDEDRDSDNINDEDTVNIIIPEGSMPSTIGEILEKEKLVDSSEKFVSKSQEMKLDTKLGSGNYTIEKGSSLENIVNIIAK